MQKGAAGNYSGNSNVIIVQPPVIADVIAPSIPQNVHIVALDHNHITVAWNASTDNAGGSGLKGYPIGTGQTSIGGADKYSTTNSFTINFNSVWWSFASQSFIIAVKADDNAGNVSAFSTYLNFTIPPAAVTNSINFTASNTNTVTGSSIDFVFTGQEL